MNNLTAKLSLVMNPARRLPAVTRVQFASSTQSISKIGLCSVQMMRVRVHFVDIAGVDSWTQKNRGSAGGRGEKDVDAELGRADSSLHRVESS